MVARHGSAPISQGGWMLFEVEVNSRLSWLTSYINDSCNVLDRVEQWPEIGLDFDVLK